VTDGVVAPAARRHKPCRDAEASAALPPLIQAQPHSVPNMLAAQLQTALASLCHKAGPLSIDDIQSAVATAVAEQTRVQTSGSDKAPCAGAAPSRRQDQGHTQQEHKMHARPAKAANDDSAAAGAVLEVSGCVHPLVGNLVRGTFVRTNANHGKPAWQKKMADGINNFDVFLYFWDSRDGNAFSGWWLGPEIGSTTVWAFNPSAKSDTPPPTGWQVPHNGAVDSTLTIKCSHGAISVRSVATPVRNKMTVPGAVSVARMAAPAQDVREPIAPPDLGAHRPRPEQPEDPYKRQVCVPDDFAARYGMTKGAMPNVVQILALAASYPSDGQGVLYRREEQALFHCNDYNDGATYGVQIRSPVSRRCCGLSSHGHVHGQLAPAGRRDPMTAAHRACQHRRRR